MEDKKVASKPSKDELLARIDKLEQKIDILIEQIKVFKLNFNSQVLNGKVRF